MNHDEAELIKRFLTGDKTAFGPLIDQYGQSALRIARRMLHDPFDAEDVSQEAFLQAFLGLSTLQRHDRFGPWLLAIVINLCKMRLRARRDWHPANEWHGGRIPENFELADLQPSPESNYEATELHEIVLAALRTLPNDQQQVVRMYYLDGLSLREVGMLAGVSVGAVKVRLHRARERLRLQLLEALDRLGEATSSAAREVSMIEVTVHDVMLRAPKDDPEAEWLEGLGKKYKLGFTRVMLLKEQAGDRILPIWVGLVEGDSIAMLLAGVSTPRPMTFELMAKLLDLAKITVEKIAITSLRKDVFYATIWIKLQGGIYEIDARPSDAVTLALRTKAPIFVAPDVMEGNRCLLTPDTVIQRLDEIHQKFIEANIDVLPEETEMEWRSFRSLPRGEILG